MRGRSSHTYHRTSQSWNMVHLCFNCSAMFCVSRIAYALRWPLLVVDATPRVDTDVRRSVDSLDLYRLYCC
ncbi:hypothetical protein FA95DRAFT_188859 [Auriscalpium vulgare]|uniref:Uncharacterized protein n=1 Tax=Auriscalpium vulgare TaxID=40419 RepID=A0ACB8S6H1_9AGAM|nr:hypothetical protein FA95DRAFT_188859 [Auriscalpium vulgare]